MVSIFQDAPAFAGGGIDAWDVSSVTDISFAFKGARLFNGSLGSWTFSNLKAIKGAFLQASSFQGGQIGNWDVSRIRDFSQL
jgi:Mycoplasma protein of unknown function, DUF285